MKAIIPLAGKGTRLRPHTHLTPKPLVRVAGRPVMSYILDDLIELGVDEIVFVVGYLRETIEAFIADEYPDIEAHYVLQEVQDGTAGAIALAEPFVDDEVLILFVDTLFDADLSLVRRLDAAWGGVIWAKEVEDYQRYGVIITDGAGAMERIVEKPSEPISRLANIGLYYMRDWRLLFEGIRHTLASDPGPSGEFYLTDAFQYMVDHGSRIQTAPVEGWYDCGKPDTLIETNEHLLQGARGGVNSEAIVEDSTIEEPVRIEAGVVVRGSTIGPNVTLEAGVCVEDSHIRHSIVGREAKLTDCSLDHSLVGAGSVLEGVRGRVSVIDDSEVVLPNSRSG